MRRRDFVKTGALLAGASSLCVCKRGRMYLTICGRAISLARPKLPIGSTRGHLALTRGVRLGGNLDAG